jgi:hypothetical protein
MLGYDRAVVTLSGGQRMEYRLSDTTYTMHRVFCATPGDLEPERRAFYDVIGEVNEVEGMPRNILFVPVSIVPHMLNKLMFQPMVESNVRDCKFFVQVLQDTWGPPARNFEPEYHLACRLRADPSFPMAGIAVFFKAEDGPQVEPKIVQLKSSAKTREDLVSYHFATVDEYKTLLRSQLLNWLKAAACGSV